MKIKIFNKIKRYFYIMTDFRATRLPVGLTAFNNWCDRLLFTYFPEDVTPPLEDSFRFSVASMVLHLEMDQNKIPNRYFGKAIQKGAANEVASFVMRDRKAKRDALIAAQQAALESKAKAEVTADTAVTNETQP